MSVFGEVEVACCKDSGAVMSSARQRRAIGEEKENFCYGQTLNLIKRQSIEKN
jgi:hypothetical protein